MPPPSRPQPVLLVRELSEQSSPRRALFFAACLVALAAAGDLYTTAEAAFTLAYIAPVALATWSAGRTAGWVISVACTCGSICVDLISGQGLSRADCANWAAELVILLAASSLLVRLRARLDHEEEGRASAVEGLRHAERLSTLGLLAAGVAHELGTPLSVVAAHAEIITTGQCGNEHVVASAKAITKQVTRMAEIIKGMLDFGRRDGDGRRPEDLLVLACESVAMVRPLAEQRHITMAVAGPKLMAEVNRFEIQQVLTNVLTNAIQAMPAGGPVKIELSRARPELPELPASDKNEFACLLVRDSGGGIAEDILPRIFDPFFTTKGVGEGTGLGLSIVYGIVRDHGGTIRASSVLGEGTSVKVFLPLVGQKSTRLDSSRIGVPFHGRSDDRAQVVQHARAFSQFPSATDAERGHWGAARR